MRLRAFALFGLAILIALTAFPGQAQAATYSVTGTEDASRAAPASVSNPTLVIQNIRGIAGEVVSVDVVFSNPTGSGFSGIGMDAVIEDPTIAEFVDVRLPAWLDPFIADFMMEFFIAPNGFPTSSISLVVPDLQEVIGGVLEDEVLATMSFRLISTGETRLNLDLFQFDSDDFTEPPDSTNLLSITEYPSFITITAATCILDMTLGYADGTLIMNFEVGTTEPALWVTWLFILGFSAFPIWSEPIEAINPPEHFEVSIPEFPSLGEVWFLTALVTSEGVKCFDSGSVDTGAPSSDTPSASELRSLLLRSGVSLPNN